MSSKYVSDGKIKMRVLRHDITALIEPLSKSIELMGKGKSDKAVFIQKEVLKNIKTIVDELNLQAVDLEIAKS